MIKKLGVVFLALGLFSFNSIISHALSIVPAEENVAPGITKTYKLLADPSGTDQVGVSIRLAITGGKITSFTPIEKLSSNVMGACSNFANFTEFSICADIVNEPVTKVFAKGDELGSFTATWGGQLTGSLTAIQGNCYSNGSTCIQKGGRLLNVNIVEPNSQLAPITVTPQGSTAQQPVSSTVSQVNQSYANLFMVIAIAVFLVAGGYFLTLYLRPQKRSRINYAIGATICLIGVVSAGLGLFLDSVSTGKAKNVLGVSTFDNVVIDSGVNGALVFLIFIVVVSIIALIIWRIKVSQTKQFGLTKKSSNRVLPVILMSL